MLQHYVNQGLPQTAELLREEAITYSVLIKILQGECTDIFTDHSRVIVCYSAPPWPVWVWCREPENPADALEIAQCLKEHFPLERGYDIILSHALLKNLKEQDAYFRSARDKMGLLSYRLDALSIVDAPCNGEMRLVCKEEVLSLVEIWQDMHMEMEGRALTREHCVETMRRMVGEKSLFVWCDDTGEIVALTARGDQGEYSKITSVYTLPRYRRRGYAINLVRGVTKSILADGLIPILYTDAGYTASNACYQKLGYRLVGRLASICK